MKGKFLRTLFILFVILSFSPLPALAADAQASQRAYMFLTWEIIDESQGLNGLRKLGPILKEEKHPVAGGGEVHVLQYDGMTIGVFVHAQKILLIDQVITKAKWPVSYDLRVGTPKANVEKTLGKSQSTQSNQWTYADGMAEVVIFFDTQNKIREIRWHTDVD